MHKSSKPFVASPSNTGELLVVTGPVLVECLPSIVSAPQYYEQGRCWGAEVGGIGFVLANAMHILSYNN